MDEEVVGGELAARGHGAAATVTGRLRFFDAGGRAAGESRYIHLYIMRGGRWWIVAA